MVAAFTSDAPAAMVVRDLPVHILDVFNSTITDCICDDAYKDSFLLLIEVKASFGAYLCDEFFGPQD